MAKKKTSQKKRYAAKKPKDFEKGFFERLKDVLPQEKKETVRVKTFIVEKPVYVPAPPERMVPPHQKYGYMDDEPERRFDSKKSRYAKKKTREEELPEEEGSLPQDEEIPEDGYGDELAAAGDEVAAEDDLGGEAGLEDEGEAGPAMAQNRRRVRSRAMFSGVWWWRAILWGFFAWVLLIALVWVMEALELVDPNWKRQWWILLGVIIAISLVYHGIFDREPKAPQ